MNVHSPGSGKSLPMGNVVHDDLAPPVGVSTLIASYSSVGSSLQATARIDDSVIPRWEEAHCYSGAVNEAHSGRDT